MVPKPINTTCGPRIGPYHIDVMMRNNLNTKTNKQMKTPKDTKAGNGFMNLQNQQVETDIQLHHNKELDEIIIKEGKFASINGETYDYKITALDVLNREITMKTSILIENEKEESFGMEISILLKEIYGPYPQNRLIKYLYEEVA